MSVDDDPFEAYWTNSTEQQQQQPRDRRNISHINSTKTSTSTNSNNTLIGKDDDGTTATVSTSNSVDSSGSSCIYHFSSGVRTNDFSYSPPHRYNSTSKKMGLDDANLSRTLDEAFGSGPPARTKSGRRNQRNKSPDRSVESQGSADRKAASASAAAPQRGLARQKSQRRDKIAAAVSLMAGAAGDSGSNLEEHALAREQARRRRAKHEDRLQAAQMDSIASGVITLGQHHGRDMDLSHSQNDDRDYRHMTEEQRNERRLRHEERYRQAFHNNAPSHSHEELGYDDYELDESYDDQYAERGDNRRERQQQPRARRPRRGSNDDDRHMHHYHSEEAEPGRRPRVPTRNASKSFDESVTNMRARGRRRASMLGGSEAAAVDRDDFRARRGRRASMAAEGSVGNMSVRTEPPPRGVRENRSGEVARRNMRRPSETAANVGGGPGLRRQRTNENSEGGDSERLDCSYNDDYDQEKQEWAEKRSEKQRAMLEKLRNANSTSAASAPPAAEEASLTETQADEVPTPDAEKKTRRRSAAGLTKAFGMSSTNFSLVDEDDKKKGESFRRRNTAEKVKPEPRKTGPGRSKSNEAPVQGTGAAGRARATDTDRRRRGTMLDRIGA